jgi:hypothetical protein
MRAHPTGTGIQFDSPPAEGMKACGRVRVKAAEAAQQAGSTRRAEAQAKSRETMNFNGFALFDTEIRTTSRNKNTFT